MQDICASRDDAQPHIVENGRCVLCEKRTPDRLNISLNLTRAEAFVFVQLQGMIGSLGADTPQEGASRVGLVLANLASAVNALEPSERAEVKRTLHEINDFCGAPLDGSTEND